MFPLGVVAKGFVSDAPEISFVVRSAKKRSD
jgi:hypothetical protein